MMSVNAVRDFTWNCCHCPVKIICLTAPKKNKMPINCVRTRTLLCTLQRGESYYWTTGPVTENLSWEVVIYTWNTTIKTRHAASIQCFKAASPQWLCCGSINMISHEIKYDIIHDDASLFNPLRCSLQQPQLQWPRCNASSSLPPTTCSPWDFRSGSSPPRR